MVLVAAGDCLGHVKNFLINRLMFSHRHFYFLMMMMTFTCFGICRVQQYRQMSTHYLVSFYRIFYFSSSNDDDNTNNTNTNKKYYYY